MKIRQAKLTDATNADVVPVFNCSKYVQVKLSIYLLALFPHTDRVQDELRQLLGTVAHVLPEVLQVLVLVLEVLQLLDDYHVAGQLLDHLRPREGTARMAAHGRLTVSRRLLAKRTAGQAPAVDAVVQSHDNECGGHIKRQRTPSGGRA